MGFMKVLVPKIGLLPFHPMIDTLPGWSSKMAFPLWALWGPRHRFFFLNHEFIAIFMVNMMINHDNPDLGEF